MRDCRALQRLGCTRLNSLLDIRQSIMHPLLHELIPRILLPPLIKARSSAERYPWVLFAGGITRRPSVHDKTDLSQRSLPQGVELTQGRLQANINDLQPL